MVMVLSKWKAAAALAMLTGVCLVGAGWVYSQQAPNWQPAGGGKTAETVTLTEPGKAPQQYLIQKSYRTADGKLAKELRSVATGEVITVYESSGAPTETPVKSTNFQEASKTPSTFQPVDVIQERSAPIQSTPSVKQSQAPVTFPASATTEGRNKSTLVDWIKGIKGGPSTEVYHEQTFVAPRSDEMKLRSVSTPAPTSTLTTTAAASAPASAAKFRTVTEAGKPAMKCLVLAEWQTTQGQRASQLQAVESGEMVTIVEMESGSPGKSTVTASLYHWSNCTTPPAGAPLPPNYSIATTPTVPTNPVRTTANSAVSPSPKGIVPTTDAPRPSTNNQGVKTASNNVPTRTPAAKADVAKASDSARIGVIEEPGKPAQKCRILVEWQTPQGQKATQLQSIETGEMVTIVETTVGTGTGAKTTAALYRWGRSTTPPPGVPIAPASPAVAKTDASKAAAQTDKSGTPKVAKSNDVPKVIAEGQKPALEVAVAIPTGPKLISEARPAIPEAPKLFPEAPKLLPEAPRVISEAPKAIAEAPKMIPELPTLPPVAPMVVVEAPKVMQEAPIVVAEAPKAIPQAPNKVAEAPNVMPEGPQVVPELPRMMPEVPMVAPGALKVVSEAPKMPPEAPRALPPAMPGLAAQGPADAPKTVEVPKTTSAPQVKERVQPPAPPKLEPKQLPSAPPVDYKKQWATPDAKATTTSKPLTDTTPPPGSIQVIPPPLPKQPAVSTVQPAVSQAPTQVIPQQPAVFQVPASAIPQQTVRTVAPPSLAPTKSMVGSQSVAATMVDPLTSPEIFAAGRTDPRAGARVPVAGTPQGMDPQRIPLGAGSVVAAANGGEPRYLPVPMVTMPQARPPMPPMAPGQQLPSMASPGDGTALNLANAFSPGPAPEAMMQANAFGMSQQPMMPPGYPMPGQAPMSMAYAGPMPPSPMGNGPGYLPMAAPVQTVAMRVPTQPAGVYANQAMDRGGMPMETGAVAQRCIATLHSSVSPTEREIAASQLSACDWRSNPQIVVVLLTTARDDRVGMVRVAAISGLARMGVVNEAVLTTLNQLKSDADPRVRVGAEQALRAIGR